MGDGINRSIVRTTSVIFSILWLAIITLNLFFSSGDYSCKKIFAFSNILLLAFGLLSVGLLIAIFSKLNKRNLIPSINKLSIILFLVQAYVFYNIQFHTTNWDPWTVYWSADLISKGQTEGLGHFYFSAFPNNQLIVFVQSIILRVNSICGVLDREGFMFMILVQCILCTLTGKLLFEIIELLLKDKGYALTGWIIFVILLGLSGWNVVTYTDMMGLIFPTAILRIYLSLKNNNKTLLKWTLIFALSFWGFKMKPTAIIVLIAIAIAEGTYILKKIKTDFFKVELMHVTKIVCIGIVSVVICNFLFSSCIKSTGLVIDKQANVGALHMMMMGMNPKNDGVWFADDVNLSHGIKNKKERTKAQIQVIKQRLSDYGINGFAQHMAKKSLIIFNDGTFAWGAEGGFYNVIGEDKNKVVSPILKSLYYNDGSRYLWLSSIEQMMWIITLFLSIGILLKKIVGKEEFVIVLSLIGIIGFNFMFEARARYIILYVPFFLVAALFCVKNIFLYAEKKKNSWKGSCPSPVKRETFD